MQKKAQSSIHAKDEFAATEKNWQVGIHTEQAVELYSREREMEKCASDIW